MTVTKTIPFDFDEIYSFVEKKFVERGYDIQPGSNAMQLATAMAYLTSMLNANTAVNVNEQLLPLARKRNSIVRDARVLGYELDHARSYRYDLDLQFANDTDDEISQPIYRYTSFKSGGLTYYYLGEELEVVVAPHSTTQVTIQVVQGELKRFTDPKESVLTVVIESTVEPDGSESAQSYVDVPYTNVEEDGIEMFLTYYDELGEFREQEPWTRSNTFMVDSDTIVNKEFIRLDDVEMRTPRLHFRLGGVGKTVRAGTIVQMNVLITRGSQGKMIELPTPTALNATVLDYRLALTGTDEESSESIKDNAPLFHNTANRIVTKLDYIAFCNRLAKVKNTAVWDGHTEVPRVAGEIWLSFFPDNIVRDLTATSSLNSKYVLSNIEDSANWYLDTPGSSNIADIYEQISRYSIPTLIFHHRNPTYMNFRYKLQIMKYVTSKTRAEINAAVFDVINGYFSDSSYIATPAENFNYEYFHTNLVKRIDTELTDVTGFVLKLATDIVVNNLNLVDSEVAVAWDVNGNPTAYRKEVIFHLGYPYEKLINEAQSVVTEYLPKIETLSFDGANNMYVDYSTESIDEPNRVTSYGIRLGSGTNANPNATDEIVGEMRVHRGLQQSIEVKLFVVSNSSYTTGFAEDFFDTSRTINVEYPSPNIRFVRNTIPRLAEVEFL